MAVATSTRTLLVALAATAGAAVAAVIAIEARLRSPVTAVPFESADAGRALPPLSAAMAPASTGGDVVSTTPDKVEVETLPAPRDKAAEVLPGSAEGLVTTVTITTGTFEITQRYRSMEGPHADYSIAVDPRAGKGPKGARELWWWKGAKVEVLDENHKPIGQEFMCHVNIDIDRAARRAAFPDSLGSSTKRLVTLTQGELRFALPDGFAVPVASDETWKMVFQVLNHNRDGVFRVR